MNGYHGNARFILEFHGQFHERATRTRSYAVIAMAHYLPQCALNIAIFHFCDYCDSPTDSDILLFLFLLTNVHILSRFG